MRSLWEAIRKMALRVAVFVLVVFGAFASVHAQSNADNTEARKLRLEQEKFEFEKRQSDRNLILSFVLTTVGGASLTWLLTTRSWSRQTKLELYRKRFDEGSEFLDQFSKAVGERFFLMQRFLWNLNDSDPAVVERLAKEYFRSVKSWNASYWLFRNKIRLFVDDSQANAFLDYQDDLRLEQPQSLHYLFVKAHRYVLKAREGALPTHEAQTVVDSLNWACSTFLENLTTSFLNKATSLQLLKTPSTETSSLKNAIGERNLPIPPRLWKVETDSAEKKPHLH